MRNLSMKISIVLAASVVAFGFTPTRTNAQLVRQDLAPGQSSAKPASQAPTGKRRLSQEVQLTGDQIWTDTGITVQPGEHVVASATGKVHYSDSQTDASPDGLARGFKDLIRILPYNDAGRGAVIGRVGDASTAQPFLIGSHCNVVSYSGGVLSVGINQMSIDTSDGTYTVHIEVYPPDSGFLAVKQGTVCRVSMPRYFPRFLAASATKQVTLGTW
jgi:hypothetical protein